MHADIKTAETNRDTIQNSHTRSINLLEIEITKKKEENMKSS